MAGGCTGSAAVFLGGGTSRRRVVENGRRYAERVNRTVQTYDVCTHDCYGRQHFTSASVWLKAGGGTERTSRPVQTYVCTHDFYGRRLLLGGGLHVGVGMLVQLKQLDSIVLPIPTAVELYCGMCRSATACSPFLRVYALTTVVIWLISMTVYIAIHYLGC